MIVGSPRFIPIGSRLSTETSLHCPRSCPHHRFIPIGSRLSTETDELAALWAALSELHPHRLAVEH